MIAAFVSFLLPLQRNGHTCGRLDCVGVGRFGTGSDLAVCVARLSSAFGCNAGRMKGQPLLGRLSSWFLQSSTVNAWRLAGTAGIGHEFHQIRDCFLDVTACPWIDQTPPEHCVKRYGLQ